MIIPKGELLAMLGLTGKVNSILPVLNCVLLKEREDRLSFAWTDLTTSIQVDQVPYIWEDGERKVKVAVPVKTLQESLELLSDSEVRVQRDKKELRVSDKNTVCMIKTCIEAKEFPLMPGRLKGKEKELELDELLRGLKKVAFAVGDDPARQVFCGVWAEFHAGKLDLIATDAHQLAHYTIPGKFGKDSFFLPTEAVRVLLKLKLMGDKVKVRSSGPKTTKKTKRGKLVQFEVGNILATVVVPELTFVKWKEIVRVQGYHTVVLPKAELIKALKTAAKIRCNSTFIFEGKKLIVETDSDERKVRQEISCRGRYWIIIKVDTKKLIEGIRQVEGDQVEMKLKVKNELIAIQEGNYRYYLMPVQET